MSTTRSIAALSAAAMALSLASASNATILASANFADYANGPLVGQNGWQQYNTQSLRPIEVLNGSVNWAGGSLDNAQDAMLAFSQQVVQPTEGTTILNFDILLSVSSAGTSPSYFAALNTLTTTATSGNFQNARLVARSSGSGFTFGARVNGQGGYPFAYGTEELSFGTVYALRAEIHMVAGNANDFINLYVGSDFSSLTLHATAAYGSGTVSDPLFGAMLLSQFGSASAFESGVSIQSMSVSLVPAPGALALLAAAGLVGRRRR
ncbi:MAG: hypothetical protein GC172_03085 [Phycisphaera sp.]|nr:hypothetical protein [Phycisphaera sp.]